MMLKIEHELPEVPKSLQAKMEKFKYEKALQRPRTMNRNQKEAHNYRYILDCLIDRAIDIQEDLVKGEYDTPDRDLMQDVATLFDFDLIVDPSLCHKIFDVSKAIQNYARIRMMNI